MDNESTARWTVLVSQKMCKDGQRLGQAMFNALWEINPEQANKVRTTRADPFYTETNIPAFFRAVWG